MCVYATNDTRGQFMTGTAAIETASPGNRSAIGAFSLYTTTKSPPRNDLYAIIRIYYVPTTYMNINTVLSVAFPEAAPHGGSPYGDRTRRARKRRTLQS